MCKKVVWFPSQGTKQPFLTLTMRIILASGSPRRKELLTAAGLTFTVEVPDVDELEAGVLPARDLCLTNALLKAAGSSRSNPNDLIIASDTVVAMGGTVYGKPKDLAEAAGNLKCFRGKTHEVMTGVALQKGEIKATFIEVSRVTFRDYPDSVIDDYLKIVPVLDKAGGYAIQDHGDWLVEKIEGDYDNIVGLPVTKVLAKLNEMGFNLSEQDV
jgi:septum formation protein